VAGVPVLRPARIGALVFVTVGFDRLERRRSRRTEYCLLLFPLPLMKLNLEPLNLFPQAIDFALLLQTALAQIDPVIPAFARLVLQAVSPHRFILSDKQASSISLSP
jgi:hypothetical protein